MPIYSYLAKNLNGESRVGVMEAVDKRELAKMLRQKGYILVSAETKDKPKKISFNFSIPFLSGVSLVDKIMFFRNLLVMINAGVSLPRALGILSEQVKNKKFKKIISEIKEKVVRGETFSDSLKNYPQIFNNLFVSMIKVGEESGTLSEVLDILSRQMEREHQIIAKVRGAMIYPIVIILVMILIGILMMILVVPKLSKIFSDLNIELPLTTKIIINLSNFLINFWYLALLAFTGFIIIFVSFFKTERGKKIRDAIFLKAPLISKIVQKTNIARSIRTLSSLIEAGVPISRSLEITSSTLSNVYYRDALKKSSQEIKSGRKLSEILANYKDIYSSLVIQMVKVGEETGETSDILKQLADFYEDEVYDITKNLSSIIEPVLMVIIGAAVGFFAISIIQPIYGIVQGF